ncbi:MAG: SIS domain-containing protein [Phycisphaerales bacterium]|nr:SIS domain-containing protein [Phycisphaerales bacterium]
MTPKPASTPTRTLAHDTESITQLVRDDLHVAARTLEAFLSVDANVRRIAEASAMIYEAIRSGNKILAIGNGGSCADAAHFCEELSGRFRDERPALPAIACNDAGHITCTANDYGYDAVFSRWVEALGHSGDVLIALSTSGNSPNVIRAMDAASERGLKTICLLGKGGGKLAGRADLEWIVAPAVGDVLHADRIQEIHMLILHNLVRAIELRMFGK